MAAGDPTGGDLCSGTTNGNTLLALGYGGPENREISLGAGFALVSGIKYAVVVRSQNPGSSNECEWMQALNGYSGGKELWSGNSGVSWNDGGGWDSWFQTKSGSDVKDSYTPVGDAAWSFFENGAQWLAQTFTAGSNYTITSVVLRLARWSSGGVPGTVTVSIRATDPGTPTKATNPVPANAALDVTLDQATLTWENGSGATSYNVYYGTQSGDLSLVSSGQAAASFTISGITNGSPFNYLMTRYWRIDSVNAAGTTTGDEWWFTTIRLNPPTPIYWYSTGSYYYQLLVQSDGSYGDPPPTGVENTDYIILASTYLPNFLRTSRILVSAANNKIWYET